MFLPTPEQRQLVENWFTYHAPTPEQITQLANVRSAAKMLAHVIIENTPPSADQTAALRKLRDATMTANASIVLAGR